MEFFQSGKASFLASPSQHCDRSRYSDIQKNQLLGEISDDKIWVIVTDIFNEGKRRIEELQDAQPQLSHILLEIISKHMENKKVIGNSQHIYQRQIKFEHPGAFYNEIIG